MPKLNEILAIEKSVNSRNGQAITKLHHDSQKGEMYDGFAKTYTPLEEGGIQYPPDSKKIVLNADDVLDEGLFIFAETIDVTATKDFGNVKAKGTIKLDSVTSIADVPVPQLLYLEKKLADIHTFVAKLPVLDEAETWKRDDAGIAKTEPVKTLKTEKVQQAITLIEPTDKHPGQAQLITKDITVGEWTNIKSSGRITQGRKKGLLAKIETAIEAVKTARERANNIDVESQSIGTQLTQWILT